MPLILHLSDLHLVDPAESPTLNDHKVALVPAQRRIRHHDLLRMTLERLGERLVKEGRSLDAIVMSGDVAHQASAGGFDAFLNLLDALGPVAPSPERTVVVPGNHDVISGLLPGDRARYERFIGTIRNAGFVTPLLDGEDAPTQEEATKRILRLDDVEIVPINSSEYAQVRFATGLSDEQWASMEVALAGDANAERALQRLKMADAARVSEAHLEALRAALNASRSHGTPSRLRGAMAAGRPNPYPVPLRIAVLHHQLLPVSTAEEVKGFESMTNLELLRQFLREHGISIVLHGHKHASVTYMDHVYDHGETPGHPFQVRVISGPAPSGPTLDPQDVFRLLEIDPDGGLMTIERIPAATVGQSLPPGRRDRVTFARPGAPRIFRTLGATVVEGDEIAPVYSHLVALIASTADEAHNVLCRIARPPAELEISTLYPGFSGFPDLGETEEVGTTAHERRLEEFRELVQWWQYPSVPASLADEPSFTHGSRIFRYDGHLNQLREVAKALCGDLPTSRSVLVLLTPGADRVADSSTKFPSFCLAQFSIQRPGGAAPPRLDCVAYFRKQEVRFWWLVNVAEIAQLQRQLAEDLASRGNCQASLSRLEPGSITTFAARAHAGESPPKVQVPRVDRYFTFARERLFAMVNALVWCAFPKLCR